MASDDPPTLVHALERAASLEPERIAVIDGERRTTWAQLHEAATRIAGWLARAGTAPGDRVGIHLPNGLDMIMALHGIMRSGACFVPIDPDSPASRTAAILADCSVDIVFTTASHLDGFAGWLVHCGSNGAEPIDGERRIALSAVLDDPDADGFAPLDRPAPDDLAYIMYTSGSTGPPKGMMHSHRSSLGFARWGHRHCDLRADDVVANFSPLHFDISVFDLFSSLLAAATVVVVPRRTQAFPSEVASLMERERVTTAFTVPFALARLAHHGALDQRDLTAVRWVLYGGEPFPPHDLAALMAMLPQARFANVFGPAEAPACVVHDLDGPPSGDSSVPIGRLAPDTNGLIVEPGSIDQVDDGEVGELLISAPSITLGYWSRPDLDDRTRCMIEGSTWFRTGDLVRRRDDGLLDFVGRGDRMIKSRGYRIELDEVEAALAGHPRVVEAAAYTIERDQVVLVAASIVASRPIDLASVKAHAAGIVPRYALPVEIRNVDSFPRTTSDKIDRRTLAADHQAAG